MEQLGLWFGVTLPLRTLERAHTGRPVSHPHFFQCEPFANPLTAFKTNAVLGLRGPGQSRTPSLFQAVAVCTSRPVLLDGSPVFPAVHSPDPMSGSLLSHVGPSGSS